MSKYLAPIHYWVYEKILIQENFVDVIVEISEREKWIESLRDIIDTEYGIVVDGNLADLIDENNIHGWLQSEIHKVERRLARAIVEITSVDESRMEILKEAVFKLGTESAVELEGLESGYKYISDRLIDGMPCDRVMKLEEMDEESIRWIRNSDIHSIYYEELNSDVNKYHMLRDEYVKGLLVDSKMEYSSNEGVYTIRRI